MPLSLALPDLALHLSSSRWFGIGLIIFYLPGLCICFDLFNQILSLVFGAKIGRADFFASVLLGLIAPLALVITSGTARSPRVQSVASLLIVWGDSLEGI